VFVVEFTAVHSLENDRSIHYNSRTAWR